eukprot:comp22249_c0_seq4/m.52824 comp22249_c0_seq4/g.52824  ORF comp22249_c0_seq4/g.52824 comp22249_c0_seq4/m.52824 type:complete len:311 (-) comp22249_c0_seq4:537-1469(-)
MICERIIGSWSWRYSSSRMRISSPRRCISTAFWVFCSVTSESARRSCMCESAYAESCARSRVASARSARSYGSTEGARLLSVAFADPPRVVTMEPSRPLRSRISARRSAMIWLYCAIWYSTLLTLRRIVVLMSLARLAYFNVLCDSSYWVCTGLTAAIITVLHEPPSESFSRRVSLLSRKLTYEPRLFLSLRALMQLASASSERLMFAPSIMRMPRFSVWLARSEPARSTSESLPILTKCETPAVRSRWATVTCRIACERELVSLAFVGSWVRRRLPSVSRVITSSTFPALTSEMPATMGPRIGSSRRSR